MTAPTPTVMLALLQGRVQHMLIDAVAYTELAASMRHHYLSTQDASDPESDAAADARAWRQVENTLSNCRRALQAAYHDMVEARAEFGSRED